MRQVVFTASEFGTLIVLCLGFHVWEARNKHLASASCMMVTSCINAFALSHDRYTMLYFPSALLPLGL